MPEQTADPLKRFIEYAAAFEACEYGAPRDTVAVQRLFACTVGKPS